MRKRPIARTGMITANATDTEGLTIIAIVKAKIIISGERTAVLIIII